MKTMAEVLEGHRVTRTGRCPCGGILLDMSPDSVAEHIAAALAAAGYGPVKEARREGAAIGWDATVSRIVDEYGNPIEVVQNTNPYRTEPEP